MSTSQLQRDTAKLLHETFPHLQIRETHRPDWLINKEGERLELDFYIEDLNLAFEIQGEQHYRFVEFFHKTRSGFEAQRRRDADKASICQQVGVSLIYIDDERDFNCCLEAIKDAIALRMAQKYRYKHIQKTRALILKLYRHLRKSFLHGDAFCDQDLRLLLDAIEIKGLDLINLLGEQLSREMIRFMVEAQTPGIEYSPIMLYRAYKKTGKRERRLVRASLTTGGYVQFLVDGKWTLARAEKHAKDDTVVMLTAPCMPRTWINSGDFLTLRILPTKVDNAPAMSNRYRKQLKKVFNKHGRKFDAVLCEPADSYPVGMSWTA